MKFLWNNAESLFDLLDKPEYGAKENWMRWYEEAWSHLVSTGLAEIDAPVDDVRIRLRIFALGWLAHDFGGAIHEYEVVGPYWEEWIDHLGINPLLALISSLENANSKDSFVQSRFFDSEMIDEYEDGLGWDEDEVTNELSTMSVVYSAFLERGNVVDALLNQFNGPGMLFASMYANCFDYFDIMYERKCELEDDLEHVRKKLQSEQTVEGFQKLNGQIQEITGQLNDAELRKFAVGTFRDRALDGPVFLDDSEDQARLNGFQWCEDGCTVVIRGQPECVLPTI